MSPRLVILLVTLLPLQSCAAFKNAKAEIRSREIPYVEVTIISVPW